ncbi:hypothetical protein GUITHDRAFT_153977 [Guillardia theta CCMP2712]|uniref:Uncharacterized protein n=1 Tax=Guillardia theta (strain CCMP2712) TaxID=905079 RepID=L1IY28_GUITC|nr:hypothetical protein GUITHDRAFT_153977 [Guillardia theta CCMP2712]EKX41012.1 hypothetical protein GUITHDRAFT_153977 [Guillardia theta CCMP2712]|eukprot:XP_005827992.1 hypothetical protein GUITHDRAFT_153977 [Guillardia theta CCMP2712]
MSETVGEFVIERVYNLSLQDCRHLPHRIIECQFNKSRRREQRRFLKRDIEKMAGKHLSPDEIEMEAFAANVTKNIVCLGKSLGREELARR